MLGALEFPCPTTMSPAHAQKEHLRKVTSRQPHPLTGKRIPPLRLVTPMDELATTILPRQLRGRA